MKLGRPTNPSTLTLSGPETWQPLLGNQQHQHHLGNCRVAILLDGGACKCERLNEQSGKREKGVAHQHCGPLTLVYSSVKTVVWGTFLMKTKIKDWKDCSESTDLSCRVWCPVCIPGLTRWKERTNLHKLFSDLHKHTVAWACTRVCTHVHTH